MDTLEKAEAMEKHAKTVTMRAESLATTEADFFNTLLDRQEEAQKHMNELSAQLSQQNTTIRSTQQNTVQRRQREVRRDKHARPEFRPSRARTWPGGTTHSRQMQPRHSRQVDLGSSAPPETQPRSKKSRRLGGDLTVRREIHRCPRSECTSKGHHCFDGYSRDAPDAGGSLVDSKHERVRSRMTSRGLVDAVAGDSRTDRHRRPCHQTVCSTTFFPGREAGADAIKARTRKGEGEHKRRSTGRGAADPSSPSAGFTDALNRSRV